MSNIPEPEQPVANRFTPDAQDRMLRLRSMASDFPDVAEPRPLTLAEVRLARGTPPAVMEKAAIFVEAAGLDGAVADVTELREAIAFELAYGGVRDEAISMARRVDHAILRRKLKAVKLARGVYRVGKGFVTLDAGDSLKTQVEEIGNTLVRRRRRKGVTPAAPEGTENANAAKK